MVAAVAGLGLLPVLTEAGLGGIAAGSAFASPPLVLELARIFECSLLPLVSALLILEGCMVVVVVEEVGCVVLDVTKKKPVK